MSFPPPLPLASLARAARAANFYSCCACPETKSKRDDCIIKFPSDEAEIKCKDLIEAHKACMRGYGFKV